MRTGLVASLLSLCLTTLGCGDSGSGVDRTRYADELSADEVSRFCKWGIEEQGGPGVHRCSDSATVTIPSQSECEAESRPHCPISLLEDCTIDIDGDVCRLLLDPPQSCKDYRACASEGG